MRQKPGDKNALGAMKFMFPNEHAIYLHETPADHLFHERLHTLSHGCVRLEQPVELAHILLRESSTHSPSEFDVLLASGEEHVLPLDPGPVYLIHQTVWVDESGVPTFTPDVYDRNTEARQALTSAMAPGTDR
ncbi:MAG: L,D-transpeptidase family protein [Gemmatimonadota bacterium]